MPAHTLQSQYTPSDASNGTENFRERIFLSNSAYHQQLAGHQHLADEPQHQTGHSLQRTCQPFGSASGQSSRTSLPSLPWFARAVAGRLWHQGQGHFHPACHYLLHTEIQKWQIMQKNQLFSWFIIEMQVTSSLLLAYLHLQCKLCFGV